ncbi:MAG: hypothetical protein HY606_07820 [Planctomycetes bacterium]|nr:hypothetical protein [Planctomycetota bacterium]
MSCSTESSIERMLAKLDKNIVSIKHEIKNQTDHMINDYDADSSGIADSVFLILREKVISDETTGSQQKFDYDKTIKEPEKYTGKYFQADGLLVKVKPEQVRNTMNYQLFLIDKQLNIYIVYLVTEPDDVMYINEDYVVCTSLFVKFVRVTVNGESKYAPLFVTKSIKIYY